MKRFVALATLVAFSLSLTACGGGGSTTATASSTDIDQLVSEYGFHGAGYWNLMRPFPQNWPLLDSLFTIQGLF